MIGRAGGISPEGRAGVEAPVRPQAGRALSGLRRAAAVARKDLLLEWRGREILAGMGFFALLIVLLLAFALTAGPQQAPAVLWVTLALAAMAGTARPTLAEAEQQTLETLLLYPGSRESLFWGKWAALAVLQGVLLVVLLPLIGVLFNVDLWAAAPALLGVGLLGIAGLAAVGTLFAALVVHARARELLMPLLLLPVALPVILAGVRLTEAVLAGAPGGAWLGILVAFDILFLLIAPILFEVVMEEA